MKMTTDVLIIGAGASGLRAACAAAEGGAGVLVLGLGPGASPEIMGFNCVLRPDDTAEAFYEDILQAGRQLNSPDAARQLAQGSIQELHYLEGLGMAFDRNADGSYNALGTLGCRVPRLAHQGALTGGAEMRLLRQHALALGVSFVEDVTVTDLVTHKGRCCGAVGYRGPSYDFTAIRAGAVVLATGGGGAVRPISTYPRTHTGCGYAMAARAGATLIDMEFQQFEPCSFVYPQALWGKIVPTTLLRSGARLLNGQGREFMSDYGLSRENARKGPLSCAIASEIAAGRGTEHGGVYYDMTMLPRPLIVEAHSIFYQPAKAAGLDITTQMAEMAPASHTTLGGVRAGADGESDLPGLFVCGEVMGGVHGADRIGGNAGAEVLVFGRQAGESAAQRRQTVDEKAFAAACAPMEARHRGLLSRRQDGPPAADIKAGIMDAAAKYVGILRDEAGLQQALKELSTLGDALPEAGGDPSALYACRDMLLFASLQAQASLLRRESRGVFNREDYPKQDDAAWRRNILLRLKDGAPVSELSPLR